jgi:hypothetical protein
MKTLLECESFDDDYPVTADEVLTALRNCYPAAKFTVRELPAQAGQGQGAKSCGNCVHLKDDKDFCDADKICLKFSEWQPIPGKVDYSNLKKEAFEILNGEPGKVEEKNLCKCGCLGPTCDHFVYRDGSYDCLRSS